MRYAEILAGSQTRPSFVVRLGGRSDEYSEAMLVYELQCLPESTDPPRSLTLPDSTLANLSRRLSVRTDLALVKPLTCEASCETDE
jgi:hypothetical protein